MSENSQVLIAPETQKIKAGDKKVLRPPSSSSSSSSESDDVELFIEQDEKVKQIQNDIQTDNQVGEQQRANSLAPDIADSKIVENDFVRTNPSHM